MPLADNGTNQHTRTGGVDYIKPMKGGTQAEYLVRRLKRDYPHIADRLAKGELKSARSAAIEAGIIVPPTPLDNLRKAWKRASRRERADA